MEIRTKNKFGTKIACDCLTVLLGIVLLLPVNAVAKMTYRTYAIIPQDYYLSHHIEDLNKDGYKDVVVLTSADSSRSDALFFDFYYQTGAGFKTAADFRIKLADDVVLFDFGDVSGDERLEFIFFTPQGLFYKHLESVQNGTPAMLLSNIESIFQLRNQRSPSCWNFARDINQDGKDELIIPALRQMYVLYHESRAGIRQEVKLPIAVYAGYSATNAHQYSIGSRSQALLRMPYLVFEDYNSDQRTDLLAVYKDRLRVICQDESGKLDPACSFDIHLNHGELWTGSKLQRNRIGEKPQRRHLMKVKDLNADGVIDLVAIGMSTENSILNPESEVRIFYGRTEANAGHNEVFFSETPDQIIRPKGTQLVLDVLDVNNDDMADLMIPAVNMGFKNIMTMLFSRSIEVSVEIYLMQPSGSYPDKPDRKISISQKFHFRGGPMAPVYELADFDGDGLIDILTSQEERRLLLFKGKKDKLFSSSVSEKFNIHLPQNGEQIESLEMNNDSRTDLFITDAPDDRQNQSGVYNRLRILLSE